MHDPWVDRLSEYMDGGLPARDVRQLEAHLRTCDACASALTGLQDVVERAHALEAGEPPRDLWSGIAAAIHADEELSDGRDDGGSGWAQRSGDDARVARLTVEAGGAGLRQPRRFSFTVPQLAAAALLLVTMGAGAVWLLAGTGSGGSPVAGDAGEGSGAVSGTILFASWAGEAGAQADVEAPAPQYAADVADLERSLEELRPVLDPATVDVVERSLESIDAAIETASAALAADPGNPYLRRQLDGAMQKKLDVLRRASQVRRGAI